MTTFSFAPRIGSNLGLAYALSSALQQVFTESFSIWIKQETWDVLEACEPFGSEFEISLESIAGLIEQQEMVGSATTCLLAGGQLLLIVPMGNERTGRMVVSGIVSGHAAELVRAFADTTLLSLKQKHELEKTRLQNEDCIHQITASFEELNWLRSLSQHFEIEETRNGLLKTAQDTLPSLRQLIGAEAIYFFGTKPASDPHDEFTYVPSPLFCEGDRLPADPLIQELMVNLEADKHHTIVQNASTRDCNGIRNVIIVPITRRADLLGWILVVNKIFELDLSTCETADWDKNLSEFGTVEAGLVETMASMLASHGRNIQLFREREELLVGVLRALINAIDAKDAYTYGHSDRVAAMAKRIAEELGHSEQECEQIHITGLLHDIGKIGVPDSVLGKPGKLTDEEFELVKQHPVKGYDILKPLERLSFVLPGVLHHHESVNGNGYPHGLKGEQIPLHARIIAIADSYDAMTSNRPYRDGMPTAKAESILRSGLGTQWDPEVGAAFFAALSDIHTICGTGQLLTSSVV